MLKIRRPLGRLIFNMGIAIPGKTVCLIETAPGPRLNTKTVFPGLGIPMLKIRRPLGRLIFNMGIAIPGKTVFLIETAPRAPSQYKDRLSRFGDSHVKDKTVGETVLSLTWESLYW